MVAAGIVKAGADIVWMAGHSGGTGASPLDTIKYGGLPVEYGVQMSHLVLAGAACASRRNWWPMAAFRRATCRQDVPLLGADAVGLGTIFMETIGCASSVSAISGCTVGVATQRKDLIGEVSGEADLWAGSCYSSPARSASVWPPWAIAASVRSSGVPICCTSARIFQTRWDGFTSTICCTRHCLWAN